MTDTRTLSRTQSLCPQCLKKIEAAYVLDGETVYMEKTCDIHGFFRTKTWQGQSSRQKWIKPKIPIEHRFHMTPEKDGCPFDCGLCPRHHQHTCTAVLEVTQNCNFHCAFCFAGSGSHQRFKDPSLDHIVSLLASVYEASPGCNLQISGGEPTLRKDLPDIVSAAKTIGFEFIQLNTNGYLPAMDGALLKSLKNEGLSSVFLQFDGVSDRVYETLRGRPLWEIKQKAVLNCIEQDIGVILVPTLVPGINVDQIGPILLFALDHAPGVRGVHFQPASHFGRHPGPPKDSDRITIPEILAEMESQTQKKIKRRDFRPSSCEHALCSFNGKFLIMEDGTLSPLMALGTSCCTPVRAGQGAKQAKASTARQWGPPGKIKTVQLPDKADGLDRFIQRSRTHMFSVSGMAFQDVWNVDLDRLKGCCIHSVAPDGRLIPFCAYNLTSENHIGLYRNP